MLPAPELRPYITTYYLTEVDEGAVPVEDRLHPEWGNVRFSSRGAMHASIGPGPLQPVPQNIGVGPTSCATHFRIPPGRYWGIGLLPLGWARFVGAPAAERADGWTDLEQDPAYAAFAPLKDRLFAAERDPQAEGAMIDAHMRALLARPPRDEERLTAVHQALVDPAVTTVGELSESSRLPVRSLERCAKAGFGFAPKLLLRRQRFLRCLAQFMLDPSLAWLETLDDQYHDQAHFIRDFRRFMGMTPSAYAAMDHPILDVAAHARAAVAGEAMQVLASPGPSPSIAMGAVRP